MWFDKYATVWLPILHFMVPTTLTPLKILRNILTR